MFYALAQDPPLIPTGNWRFEHVLQDIQTLNQRAMKGELEITAISIHAYPYVADKYALTSCGSSMGDKYGPMVVAREPDQRSSSSAGKTIAIPGKLTTAFLALQLCLGKAGDAFEFHVVPFDQILHHVRDGNADAGLIIHEGQLTFSTHNLHLIVDLGAWWHEKTQLPLPLGGNCIRKDLGREAMQEVTDILKALDPIQPRPPPPRGRVRAAIRPRPGSQPRRPLRRDVREPLDAGLRQQGARSDLAAADGRRAARDSCRMSAGSSTSPLAREPHTGVCG